MREFWVADLTPTGEVRCTERYDYDTLSRLPGAMDLITIFSTYLWRSPEGFDLALPGGHLSLQWLACAPTCGVARLAEGERLRGLALLLTGGEVDSERTTIAALQRQWLAHLHDTGTEPAFDLAGVRQRPLVASMGLSLPAGPTDRILFGLYDRCLGASYFRKAGLA